MKHSPERAGKLSETTGLFDKEFKHHKGRYILQCTLAMLCVLAVLTVLNTLSHGIAIASLGASSFIAFAMPYQRSSTARAMIGGYTIGIMTGTVCYLVSMLPEVSSVPYLEANRHEVFGAIAVGMAIFLMVITQSGHPPAAGLALGFVTNGADIHSVIIVEVGIVALYALKTLLKPALMDLT
ncbi:MAG: HPP family protein [Anaerolineae bacterium]|nr:HPP family protein [Anaerolineae bacterium]